MATHRVVVMMQNKDFGWWAAGKLVDYDGPANWKLEPLDPVAREDWEREISDPDRVAEANRRSTIGGQFAEGESVTSPGGVSGEGRRLPPSGMGCQ